MTWSFMGFHMPRDGYGYATIKIAQALQRESSSVGVVDMREVGGGFGDSKLRAWSCLGDALALCTPDWLRAIGTTRLVNYTMFEATRLPVGWVNLINRYAQVCVVPCEWNKTVFVENGVTAPVRVVRWGVDPADYWLLDRADHGSRPYTFLWSGTPDRRKGWDIVYKAFWLAFRDSPDVRLKMHFRSLPRGVKGCRDANVEIVHGLVGRTALRRMLADADAFVFPSRGEGWGLPPREAAATGLPVIATDQGGLAEEIASWALPLRVAGKSPADYGFWEWGEIGDWVDPDVEHCAELMRWCFENREDAARLGEAAADWIAQKATWSRTARGLIEVMGGDA
jgi:glycosyltransferase involved in cell wall biosynthesis